MENIDETIMTLQKYWLKANLMKEDFDKRYEKLPYVWKNDKDLLFPKTNNNSSYINVFFDFWIASLYCAFQGYRTIITFIPFNDAFIKEMKKYRDSTFHFETIKVRQKKIETLKYLSVDNCRHIHDLIGDFLAAITKVRQFKIDVVFEHKPKIITSGKTVSSRDENTENFYILKNYWKRADVFLYRMKDIKENANDPHTGYDSHKFYDYNFFWLSAVYIVIEGYQKLGFSNSDVDELLSDTLMTDMLKRVRHSVFDYHHKYYNWDLISDSVIESKRFTDWICELHCAFYRFLKDVETQQLPQ